MLVKFEIENFRSFSQRKVFHTIQRNYKRFPEHIFKFNENLSLLKTTGIYGSNASGKTNLFRGLHFVKKLVEDQEYLNSFECSKSFVPFRLNKESIDQSSKFLVDFIIEDSYYSYQLEVNHKNQMISYERLSLMDENENMIEIFTREINSENKASISLKENNQDSSVRKVLEEFYTKNSHSTFLGNEFVKNDHIIKSKLWFSNKVQFLFPIYKFMDIAYILSLKDFYLDIANKLMRFSKTGINRLSIDRIPIGIYLGSENKEVISYIEQRLDRKDFHSFKDSNENECTAIRDKDDGQTYILKLNAIHLDENGNDVKFDLNQESRGTIVLLHLLPALILSYGEGVNYFIDEINRSLHPILIREILAQYLTHNIDNANGQFIFNSHEDFMIDENIVRQDEIWLMEKEKNGQSDIFPLSDFPNIRHDLNLRKNYLDGKFGGVPFESKPSKLKFGV
jgi:AAA15 family ATPase/GTPase